jgi:hypothetical protein
LFKDIPIQNAQDKMLRWNQNWQIWNNPPSKTSKHVMKPMDKGHLEFYCLMF